MNNNRVASPFGLPFRKHKKKKVKNFDFSEDGMPDFSTPEPIAEPKAPSNITETPDLPAGVDIPPVQFPHKEKKTVIETDKKEKVKKPKELETLYGPDHNMKDDMVVNSPLIPNKIDHPPVNPDLDLEQGISDIFDGTAEEPIDEPLEEPVEEPVEEIDEPDQSTQPVPDPPVHEFCHCEVKTMPGGRRIWRANEGACSDCLRARDTFNQWQLSLFGS